VEYHGLREYWDDREKQYSSKTPLVSQYLNIASNLKEALAQKQGRERIFVICVIPI